MSSAPPANSKLLWALAGVLLAIWAAVHADWMWAHRLPSIVYWIVFTPTLPLGAWGLRWAWRNRPTRGVAAAAVASLVYVLWWQLALFATDAALWDGARVLMAQAGLAGLFFIGLVWVVWGVERASRHYELLRRANGDESERAEARNERTANPLDPHAWYYGRENRKLNQSLTALLSYSAAFALVCLIFSQLGGCQQIYELPAGGGEQKAIAQTVKIQKIIRKKFVVNPYSAILFKVPPIDEVKLQLDEITENTYTVGQGAGEGAGFGAGTDRGKVRFIRLEYSGGDWDQDFGVGADLNMLIEYNVRTRHKVADRTESIRVGDLKTFPKLKSPPMVYMTGQGNISLSNSEIKILRTYLLDNHGMLFGDNGGSRHFHNQFLQMMSQVLPNIKPVPIPLDDQIHRIPFRIPFLPYVAPHGGRDALGWWTDGRWVAYYHPGDIADAWADGHAGVKPEVWEACFQLGTNVIFYAHAEYSKWVSSQGKK